MAQPPVNDDANKARRTPREAGQDAVAKAQETAERARLTFRRLSGLDRSGPPPPQTLPGQPLNPWTIPNAIGFVRLALLPVFLAFAFSSGDGVSRMAVIIFAVVAWSDYLDGIAARVTGQYSRLGALLDPLVDRLLIISGVAVCWYFELLPRWALAILVARELFMIGQTAQRPTMFTSRSIPLRRAYWVSTSMNASRAASSASAHRGSSSKYQQTATPEITSRRSTSGSSSAPMREYWPVTRAVIPSR